MTPRYKLRTLLILLAILLAILPPLLAVGWWKYSSWRAELERQANMKSVVEPPPHGE